MRKPKYGPVFSKDMSLEERLMGACEKMPNGCWEWRRGGDARGYGNIGVNGKQRLAHRVSYETFIGPIPDGLLVMHKCDNPPCINPDHLVAGTCLENEADKIRKGRKPAGENHPNSKLTWEEVRAMRDLYASGKSSKREISRLFHINRRSVFLILAGKQWAEIGE